MDISNIKKALFDAGYIDADYTTRDFCPLCGINYTIHDPVLCEPAPFLLVNLFYQAIYNSCVLLIELRTTHTCCISSLNVEYDAYHWTKEALLNEIISLLTSNVWSKDGEPYARGIYWDDQLR